MNRNHLALFAAVCEAGSISRAAERLMISQPAVSLQVAELEKALGLPLLERLPRGVRPTAAGALLNGYARQITTLETQADLAIREFRGLVRGRLIVGASLTIGSYLAPALLADFHARHPAIDITLDVANTRDVQDRVLRSEIEIGLTEGFVEDAALQATVFARDELVLVVGPAHPLAGRKLVTAGRLAEHELVLREPGSGTRAVVERAIRSRGLTPRVAMSLGSTEAVKAAVSRGIGAGFVSALAVETEVAAGTLLRIRVGDLQLHRDLHALTLRGRTLSPTSDSFLAQLSEAA